MSMPHVNHDATYDMHVYASRLVPRVDCVFRHRLACRFFLRARRDCDKTTKFAAPSVDTEQEQAQSSNSDTMHGAPRDRASGSVARHSLVGKRLKRLGEFRCWLRFFISSDFVLHFRDCTRHGDHLRGGAAFLMNMSSGTAPVGFIGAAAGEIDLHGEFKLLFSSQG